MKTCKAAVRPWPLEQSSLIFIYHLSLKKIASWEFPIWPNPKRSYYFCVCIHVTIDHDASTDRNYYDKKTLIPPTSVLTTWDGEKLTSNVCIMYAIVVFFSIENLSDWMVWCDRHTHQHLSLSNCLRTRSLYIILINTTILVRCRNLFGGDEFKGNNLTIFLSQHRSKTSKFLFLFSRHLTV